MSLHTITYSRMMARQNVVATKKKTLKELKRELKTLREENSKLHIQWNQMRMKPRWNPHSHRIEHPDKDTRMRPEIYKQFVENKPDVKSDIKK